MTFVLMLLVLVNIAGAVWQFTLGHYVNVLLHGGLALVAFVLWYVAVNEQSYRDSWR